MTPGFLVSALAGWAAALLVALAAPSRRGGWAWTMIAGLLGGGLSGFALYELGAGALGGAASVYAPADARGIWTYSVGGVIGGVSTMVLMLLIRAIFYAPRRGAATGLSEMLAGLSGSVGGGSAKGFPDVRPLSPQTPPPAPRPATPPPQDPGPFPPISADQNAPTAARARTANRKALSRMGP